MASRKDSSNDGHKAEAEDTGPNQQEKLLADTVGTITPPGTSTMIDDEMLAEKETKEETSPVARMPSSILESENLLHLKICAASPGPTGTANNAASMSRNNNNGSKDHAVNSTGSSKVKPPFVADTGKDEQRADAPPDTSGMERMPSSIQSSEALLSLKIGMATPGNRTDHAGVRSTSSDPGEWGSVPSKVQTFEDGLQEGNDEMSADVPPDTTSMERMPSSVQASEALISLKIGMATLEPTNHARAARSTGSDSGEQDSVPNEVLTFEDRLRGKILIAAGLPIQEHPQSVGDTSAGTGSTSGTAPDSNVNANQSRQTDEEAAAVGTNADAATASGQAPRRESLPGAFPIEGIAMSNRNLNAGEDEDEGTVMWGQPSGTMSLGTAMSMGTAGFVSSAFLVEDSNQFDEETSPLSDDPSGISNSSQNNAGNERTPPGRRRSSRYRMEDLEAALDVKRLSDQAARNADQAADSTNKKRIVVAFVVSLILCCAITTGLTFGLRQRSPVDDDDVFLLSPISNTGTAAPLFQPFDQKLHRQIIKNIENNVTSPQYKANAWLLEDPNFEEYPDWRKHQRFALAAMYFATAGDQWFQNDNWLSYEIGECDWFTKHPTEEAICDDAGHYLIRNLTNNNLYGVLPLGLHISTLKVMDVSHNRLHGQHPPAIQGGSLEIHILSNNSFVGRIVGEAGFYNTSLRVVKVDNNQLEGEIFLTRRLTPMLEIMNVTGNRYYGTISDRIADIPTMKYLGIGHSFVSGPIPSEIGLLTGLTGLDLSGNTALSGNIPESFANLSKLSHLDVSGTSISGRVPQALCEAKLEIVANCSVVGCC
ncbi:Leucine Rich Repeat [Seminavis robusta]|uniref:Leucine Rich Repeat n=1 Tax=Seminavis robusta TaxID=568900 RepID=A0A9N8ESP6_9STRA|nr:Leucine Rich Repeat [Seminavis robusta]|eukprot:Sro1715_g293070.1 Leucine Rich Repeat (824) ;mRNA; f:9070-11541